MTTITEVIDHCLGRFDEIEHELSLFKDQVKKWFETHPKLSRCKPPVIHSVKDRLKDKEHLAKKVRRKLIPDSDSHQVEIEESWQPEEVFKSITDLAGVRVLLLHQNQFEAVHDAILKKQETGDWVFHERPKAYTWDPDSAEYFNKIGFDTQIKESHYTSVHYVIRPRSDSVLACEVQGRTLFEEIWGEVDHTLNYPEQTDNLACREQLRVLAKVVGAGSRLVDSIFNIAGFTVTPAQPRPEQVDNQIENGGLNREILPPIGQIGEANPIPPTEKPSPEEEREGLPDNPEIR
ncbi:RelA/SpoT domain-containing protein [Pseudomonas aeruginosa]|uniref:RelA/SpoT domain-containing protein n=1 Tax=Pseudomonas aeruginosa TaxID=287 RepID=UPI003CFB760B